MEFAMKPIQRPMFQMVQEKPPNPTLRRVLWNKFLKWVEKSPAGRLVRAFVWLMIACAIVLGIIVQHFIPGAVMAIVGPRSVSALVILFALMYWRTCVRVVRYLFGTQTKVNSNQHTFHGVAVPDLADYVFRTKSFTTDAERDLGLAQRQFRKIAAALEDQKILVRGENNARVLNPTITREQFVRQVRDDFPLAEHNGEWVERKGSFHLFLKDEERRDQKKREKAEKLERRIARLERKKDALASITLQ